MQVAFDPVLRFCGEFVGGNSSQSQTKETTACYEVSRNSSRLVPYALHFTAATRGAI